jgi:hypothetical protein
LFKSIEASQIIDHDDYIKFISRSEATLLYSINKYKIGRQGIDVINMQAHPVKTIDVGKNVTNRIFGIGIKNENSEKRIITIDKIIEPRIP